jgi:hypothetical protein
MEQTENFYVQKKKYWLRFLNSFMNNKQVEKKVLLNYFSPEKIREIRVSVQQEFEALLPQIPDFGRTQVDQFAIDMIKNAQSLAFYRVLQAEGVPLRTIGQIMFEIAEVYYANMSPVSKFLFRSRITSPRYLREVKRKVEAIKSTKDPEDYHVEFVDGDGKNLIFGLNYTNCAATYLLKKHNASELHPYLCLCDYPMMRGFKVGFNREQNLATGGSMCAFRFYRDYPTPIGWPPEEVPEYKDFKLN